MSVCLSVCLLICLCLSVFVYFFTCISPCMTVRLFLCVSVVSALCLCACLCVWMCTCLCVSCLVEFLQMFVSCLSVCLSVCPSVAVVNLEVLHESRQLLDIFHCHGVVQWRSQSTHGPTQTTHSASPTVYRLLSLTIFTAIESELAVVNGTSAQIGHSVRQTVLKSIVNKIIRIKYYKE